MNKGLHRNFGTANGDILLLKLLYRTFLLHWILNTATGEGLLLLHKADIDLGGAADVRVDPTASPACSMPRLGRTVTLKLNN